jgi:hypothetical protein
MSYIRQARQVKTINYIAFLQFFRHNMTFNTTKAGERHFIRARQYFQGAGIILSARAEFAARAPVEH